MMTFIGLFLLAGICHGEMIKVGNFRGHSHGVKGEVFIKNRQTLVVKNFEYDGQGPDAFFWVGTSTQVSEVGWVLPYPFQGRFYEYQDENVPILKGKFDGQKDLELTLPEHLKASDLTWISVWCRRFKANFGEVYFDDIDPEKVEDFEAFPEQLEADSGVGKSSVGFLALILAFFV